MFSRQGEAVLMTMAGDGEGWGLVRGKSVAFYKISVPLARYLHPSGVGECVSVTSTAEAKGTATHTLFSII